MTFFHTEEGKYEKLGVTIDGQNINIAVENRMYRPLSIEFFDRKTKKHRATIPFCSSHTGTVYSMKIMDVDRDMIRSLCYRLKIGSEEIVDPYAAGITGTEKFGVRKPFGLFEVPEYSWKHRRPHIAWRDTILYQLNVRGFTEHISSKAVHRGTFTGITEKLDHLRELGVTSLILQPAYDFDEIMKTDTAGAKRINYWGYTGGFYFAPKGAYSSGSPSEEFMNMTDTLHGAGMEVIMQFYFEPDIRASFIIDVLRHWVTVYHIDGFELLGAAIPLKEIATDPIFADTKILAYGFDADNIYGTENTQQTQHTQLTPVIKNLAKLQDDFMCDGRKFLKGDEDMLGTFTRLLLDNPEKTAVINYMTSYYGFTLNDLVSYDQKHNEENGEENRDGSDYNYSWNCGAEGRTRKKAVLKLRRVQMKNALAFMMLAQGVPMLRAGDEFCNSQCGNNNPYCQDNRISWLNWEDKERNSDIFSFTKELIAFRKDHPVFRSRFRKKMMDYISCGTPDVSFHGEQAWAPGFANFNRHIAVMYDGEYEKLPDGNRDADFYVAYNMHWQNHRFNLPNPSKGRRWKVIMQTVYGFMHGKPEYADEEYQVPARSISLIMAVSE